MYMMAGLHASIVVLSYDSLELDPSIFLKADGFLIPLLLSNSVTAPCLLSLANSLEPVDPV